MKSKLIFVVFLFFITPLSLFASANDEFHVREHPCNGFADLVDSVRNSVVNVFTTQKVSAKSDQPMLDLEEFLERFGFMERRKDRRRVETSLGSGFLISEDGLIMTNNHVVENASDITIKFYNGVTANAELVGSDKTTDIAILKIKTKEKLKALSFGNSDKSRIGDWVLAIGNPFGLGGTVTFGVISARGRDINQGPLDDFIQTDASINTGNSGGPLFNTAGEVIGINTAIFSPSGGSAGVGFAIPSNTAKYVSQKLLKEGKFSRAWLGVMIQNVSGEIAKFYSQKEPYGALVAQVTDDSPAKKAGIKPGDLIVAVNGKKVENAKYLTKEIAYSSIGDVVTLKIMRGNKEISLNTKLEKIPDSLAADSSGKHDAEKSRYDSSILPGVTLQNISDTGPDIKKHFKINSSEGVLVRDVDSSSIAARYGMRKGYIIFGANHQITKNIKQLKEQINISKKNDRPVLLLAGFDEENAIFIAIPVSGE